MADSKISNLSELSTFSSGADLIAIVSGGATKKMQYENLFNSIPDDIFRIADEADASKGLRFQLSGLTTFSTRTLTVPDASGIIALTSAGTANSYSKYTSATTIGNALLSDDGTNIIVPSGKFITSQDTTKIVMDFGTTSSEFFAVTTDQGAYATPYIYMDLATGVYLTGVENATTISQITVVPNGSISIDASNGLSIASRVEGNPYTATVEINSFYIPNNNTRQWATGAIGTQREFRVDAPTYAFVGASTITNAATFAIAGAPIAGTNATITNSYALWVQGGISKLDGTLVVGTPATYTISNVTTDRSYDANATTLDEVADALGTLIADLRTIGLVL